MGRRSGPASTGQPRSRAIARATAGERRPSRASAHGRRRREVVGGGRHARRRREWRACAAARRVAQHHRRRREADFRAGQQEVLEMIATGASLCDAVLDAPGAAGRAAERRHVVLGAAARRRRRARATGRRPEPSGRLHTRRLTAPRSARGRVPAERRCTFGQTIVIVPTSSPIRSGKTIVGWHCLWLSSLLVDADLFVAEAGARLVRDVLRRAARAARRRDANGRGGGQHRGNRHRAPAGAGGAALSEERNRAILRAIPDWMFILSADGVFLDYHAKEPSRAARPADVFLGRHDPGRSASSHCGPARGRDCRGAGVG